MTQSLIEMINKKAEQKDIERLAQAIEDVQQNSEQRAQSFDEGFENLVQDFKLNMETLRLQTLDGLKKKADFAFIEKIREQLSSKVDFEYFQNHMQKVRQEIDMQIELSI